MDRTRLSLTLLVLIVAACASAETTPPRLEEYAENPPELQEILETDWRARAENAELRHAWEEAAFCLDRWLLGHTPDRDWYEHRAVCAERSGDYATGVEMRRKIFDDNPDDLLARIDLADDLQLAGRGLEGAALMEAIASDPETSILALRSLGELHYREERWLEAAEAYERLAADPRVPDSKILYQNAASLREKGGDLSGALADLEKALEGVDLAKEERRTLSRLKAFETGEPRNVADAVALLLNSPKADFRLAGALYLTHGSFPDDVPVFISATQDPDPRVARIAIREVSMRGSTGDAVALTPLLRVSNQELRISAVRGLSRIGTPRQIPDLLPLLDPSDRAQFRAVRSALEEISGFNIGVELDPELPRRIEIAGQWHDWWRENRSAFTKEAE